MSQNPIDFRHGTVQPLQCLKSGWNLIKDQYWVFVGISLVGMLIGSLVPFGIILGPMMCGIYLSLFQRRRGETVDFGNLFKGFDYFGESIIATLLHFIPVIAIMVPFYIAFYIGIFLIMPDARHGGEVNPARLFGFIGLMIVFGLVMTALIIVISVLFAFAYPLIVERKLSGLDSVKLSVKAGLANFWRLLGLMFMAGLLNLAGMLVCYVGMFLVLPVTLAAIVMAYEQVFGLGQVQSPHLPPPPPSFS